MLMRPSQALPLQSATVACHRPPQRQILSKGARASIDTSHARAVAPRASVDTSQASAAAPRASIGAVVPQCAATSSERRVALDGIAYTYEAFANWYGRDAERVWSTSTVRPTDVATPKSRWSRAPDRDATPLATTTPAQEDIQTHGTSNSSAPPPASRRDAPQMTAPTQTARCIQPMLQQLQDKQTQLRNKHTRLHNQRSQR